MKKLFTVIIFVGAIFFGMSHLNLFANNTVVDEEQLLALLDEKTVVISGGQIYNLTDMHEFYENVLYNVDSDIYLIIDPYTQHTREYLLQSIDGQILLFSSTEENSTYNHKVGEYAKLFRIYRGQEIHYVLECSNHTQYVLFSHGMN